MVLPWLNPFAPGPTPNAAPLMFAWACVAILLGVAALYRPENEATRLSGVVPSAWLTAAALSCGIALFQYFGQAQALGQWASHTEMGEAFGNLRQRNQFATLTSIGLLALLWRVAQWRPDDAIHAAPSAPRAVHLTAWLVCSTLLALGNAASGSRTGLLQWCLVAVLLAVWWRKMPRHAMAMGLGTVALYLLAIRVLPWLLEVSTGLHAAGLMGRFNEDVGCSSRRVLWANVLHLVAQKPWLGWGWGELGYAHFITLYPAERFCDILDNAHNLPLHLAVELGLPFSLLVFAVLAALVWRARPWRETNATRQLAWGVLAVVALHSLVEYPLWYGPFQMAAGLAVWLLRRTQHQEQAHLPDLALVFSGALAMIFVVILGFTAWDYWRVSQLYMVPADRAKAYREDTMDKVRGSVLFAHQVQFAELTTATVAAENAQRLHALALGLLHFSPEPRVVEKLIESAVMLGHDDEALFYLQRYQAAFPQAHAAWAAESASHKTP
jgi:O-antigen ligase